MPKGVPVATVAIGNAANAGLLAARILGTSDLFLLNKMATYQVTAVLPSYPVQLSVLPLDLFRARNAVRAGPGLVAKVACQPSACQSASHVTNIVPLFQDDMKSTVLHKASHLESKGWRDYHSL